MNAGLDDVYALYNALQENNNDVGKGKIPEKLFYFISFYFIFLIFLQYVIDVLCVTYCISIKKIEQNRVY